MDKQDKILWTPNKRVYILRRKFLSGFLNFDDQRYLIKSDHNFASIIHFFKFCLEIEPKLAQTDYNFHNHADRVFVSMLNLLILKIMQKFNMTLLSVDKDKLLKFWSVYVICYNDKNYIKKKFEVLNPYVTRLAFKNLWYKWY